MRKVWFRLLCATWLLAAGTPVRAEVRVVDDSGATISLAQPAKRIISLAPHLTETLFAAGAGERIVGTVEYSEWTSPALRWSLDGAEAVLRLRSLRASGDFEEYMAFHHRQERQRNYLSAPQNNDIKLAA
jgi:hypothetical protein